ncbi:MAG: Uma2 family endonuclease [Candidatus Xenobia bacterium]
MALQKHMTEAEFDEWVMTQDRRAEYVDGKVILLMHESRTSDRIRVFLTTLLHHMVQDRGVGVIHGPSILTRLRPGLRRVPDLMVVMKDREKLLEDTCVDGGPSVAVEVVSADSVTRDKVEKLRDYDAAGVDEYWIIDPGERGRKRVRPAAEALFYRRKNGVLVPVRVDDGIFRSSVIPGFWLQVAWLWQNPTPPVLPILRAYGLL